MGFFNKFILLSKNKKWKYKVQRDKKRKKRKIKKNQERIALKLIAFHKIKI
jgi:uncharacterized protein YeeX (DUF496 family)